MEFGSIKWKSSRGTALYILNGELFLTSRRLADPLGEPISKEICKEEIGNLMRRVSIELTGRGGTSDNPVVDYWLDIISADGESDWACRINAFCPADVTPFSFVNAFQSQLKPSDWFTGPLLVDFRQNDSWLWEFILDEKY